MPVCEHCMLEVAERDAVYDVISGQRRVFCCHGCSGIYRLIRSEGLEEFYAKRRQWKPGPAEDRVVDASAFQDGLRPVGSELETDVIVDGIRCASCVWLNEKILLRTEGVTYAKVNYATHRARLRWDPAQIDISTVLSRIRSIGYMPKPFLPKAFEDEQKRQARDLLIRFGTASFFSMQLMLFSIALYAGYFQGIDEKIKAFFHVISFVLTTPVVFYSGWPIIKGSVQGLRNLTFNMDVLIAAGALSAYAYSVYQMTAGGEVYFDTAAMIITLILLGRYIEAGAKRKASETISRLMQLEPKEARKLDVAPAQAAQDDRLHLALRRMVPVSSLRPGDIVEVVPGEKVPVDGVVLSGASEADESMLTGESRPKAKTEGAQVFGGTQNLYGSVVFQVTKAGKDTVLAHIIRAVEDAQARRAPIQSVADRVVGWFVPAVLLIALLTFLGWLYHGAPASAAVMNAVSVMVIACPCALGLATPLAILIGTSNGASRGILIKGGDVIEKAASVDFVVFDKTGTVTEGKPVLCESFGIGVPAEDAMRLALSLERRAEHSLGRAIVDAARGLEPFEVSDFSVIPGRGVRGMIRGKPAAIGNREFIEAEGIGQSLAATDKSPLDPPLLKGGWGDLIISVQPDQNAMNNHLAGFIVTALDDALSARIAELENSGSTIIFLSLGEDLRGVFAVSDKVRPEAAETVAMLEKAGLGVAMITGDNLNAAEAAAKKAGIVSVKAQASPTNKAAEIRKMEDEGKKVLMTGDGINDAPALVEATVGVAMGRATDIALESADMVVMRPDLRLVADAIALAKKTFSVVRQNIFFAFFYNAAVIPLAILGFLHPIMAAGAMTLSSLTVVGNSLRARLR